MQLQPTLRFEGDKGTVLLSPDRDLRTEGVLSTTVMRRSFGSGHPPSAQEDARFGVRAVGEAL